MRRIRKHVKGPHYRRKAKKKKKKKRKITARTRRQIWKISDTKVDLFSCARIGGRINFNKRNRFNLDVY